MSRLPKPKTFEAARCGCVLDCLAAFDEDSTFGSHFAGCDFKTLVSNPAIKVVMRSKNGAAKLCDVVSETSIKVLEHEDLSWNVQL